MFRLLCLLLLMVPFTSFGQEALPFDEIPPAPEEYTACNVMARTIEGLGFRYRWATEDLTESDLKYQFSESSRTLEETIDHIYGLAETIVNAVEFKPSVRPLDIGGMTYEEKRSKTLMFLKTSAEILRKSKDSDLNKMNIVFKRGETESSFPFWNHLNGPIADALWHTGQVVASRRASGNPFSSKVSVFMGRVRQ